MRGQRVGQGKVHLYSGQQHKPASPSLGAEVLAPGQDLGARPRILGGKGRSVSK